MNFMRTTAGAFGTSITLTAWQNAAAVQHNDLSGALNDAQRTIDNLSHSGFSLEQARSQLDYLVTDQATIAATDHIFLVVTFIFAIGAMAVWLAPKTTAVAGPAAGGH
jgi:DHA2 family multidrug resistance protein